MTVLDGRYRLIAPLARGGMSTVWRGHDDVLERPVAIKIIDRDVAEDASFMDRVRHEATAVARLAHPHIATVYDYGESRSPGGASVPYLVMELVDGETLAEVLTRGRLTWPTAVGVCAQVASALAAAHASGVVHRDITPNNVMLSADGVKIIDFGIAATTGEACGTRVFGTPAYLAPERLSGGVAQPATDVYGLGLLLYQTLTGHLPWPVSTVTQMLAAHCHQLPAPLPPIDGLPDRVADACRRCLAVDPAMRPASAALFRELASLARSGDARRGQAGAGPALTVAANAAMGTPSRTRIMPHGLLAMPDTGCATVPIDVPPPATRQRPMFVLPTLLLALLLACLGISELRPGAGGVNGAGNGGAGSVGNGRAGSGGAGGSGGGGAGNGGGVAAGPIAPALIGGRPQGVGAPAAPLGAPPAAALSRSGPAMACRVDYALTTEWAFGFTAQLTIDNVGPAAIAGWTLQFPLASGLNLGAGWNGRWVQQDDQVTVRAMAYNGSVPPGGSVTIGFLGTADHTTISVPSAFTLNGTACGTGS